METVALDATLDEDIILRAGEPTEIRELFKCTLELEENGLVIGLTACVTGFAYVPTLTCVCTVFEEETLAVSQTFFLESSCSTSLCSLLTFSTKAFFFFNSS